MSKEIPEEILKSAQIIRELKPTMVRYEKAKTQLKDYMMKLPYREFILENIQFKLSNRSRTGLSSELLRVHVTQDVLNACTKVTEYQELRIKDLKED